MISSIGTYKRHIMCPLSAREKRGRMAAECAALGGHGVVGVQLSGGALPLSGLDFTAADTAVRARGAAHGQRALFTCDISGQDFAKLITAAG